MIDYEYAYLAGDIIFFLIWIFLFWLREDLRKKMLVMSLLIAPFGFTQFLYFRDYWKPTYPFGTILGSIGFEDILFCFFVGGITAVIYEEIFGIRYAKRHLKHYFYWMLGYSIIGTIAMFLGSIVFGLNSMHVSIVLLLLIGILILISRHDLLKEAFFSGLLFSGLFFSFYLLFFNVVFDDLIHEWWLLKNISGILIWGVPLEEIAWGFSFGFVAGPAYEFINGLKLKES